MRKDMGKVITERERSGSSLDTEKFGKTIRWMGWEEEYDEPKRHSGTAGRTYGWEKKQSTDVLSPLKRWLNKQVGRPWNKVWSELVEQLDRRKVTHEHVITHVMQWVCVNVFYGEDGKWHEQGYAWKWHTPEYYVHPRTGLLCKNKDRETKSQRTAQRRKSESEQRQDAEYLTMDDKKLEKIEGIWYWVEYRKATHHEERDYFRGQDWNNYRHDGRTLQRKLKYQVNKKDLARINDWVKRGG